MSNRTLVDIKKILKEYKIPTNLNKPELLLVLDTVEKLKEKGESDDKIRELASLQYSEIRKTIMEASGAAEKKIVVKEVKKDATVKYKELLDDYRKGVLNLAEYSVKSSLLLDEATKVQQKIIKDSYKTIIENLNSSDEENDLYNSLIDKKISAEEFTERRNKLQKKQEKKDLEKARKEFQETLKGGSPYAFTTEEQDLIRGLLEKGEELTSSDEEVLKKIRQKIKKQEQFIEEKLSKINRKHPPPLLPQEGEEEKQDENILDKIIEEFKNLKIGEEEIIKRIETLTLNEDQKELFINRLQVVIDDKKQKSVIEIQDIVNSLQPIVSQFDNGLINRELFEKYVDEKLVGKTEKEKMVIKNILDQFITYKEEEYKNIKTEENKELENSIRLFDEQNTEKVLEERDLQERNEELKVPYKTVDAVDNSDPPTNTPPIINILNKDQPKTVDPNLPINMQPEPIMKSLDPDIVNSPDVSSKKEDDTILGPTNTSEVLAMVSDKITNLTSGEPVITEPTTLLTTEPLPPTEPPTTEPPTTEPPTTEPPTTEPPTTEPPTTEPPTTEPPTTEPTISEVISGSPLKVEITYEVKYHKFQVNEFFGSIDNPDWDLALNKSITGNYDNGYYTKEILIEQISGMISDKKLKIYKQATTIENDELDILTEYVIVSQLHFCVLRNLQRGNRSKTAMVPLKSLIDLRNTVAGSGTDNNTTFQSVPTAQEVPNVLKQDITIRDISKKFTDRKYRGNVILYDNVYKNIVESGHLHSGGNNVIFGPSNLNDPLGLMDDFVNPYKNPKYIIKTTIK